MSSAALRPVISAWEPQNRFDSSDVYITENSTCHEEKCTLRHCCQVSPKFPSQFEKKLLHSQLCSHISIFKKFRTKQFCEKKNSLKMDFLSKLPMKKLKTVRKCFTSPFLPLFCQNLGPYGRQNPSGIRFFVCLFSSYFAEFSPPGNSATHPLPPPQQSINHELRRSI